MGKFNPTIGILFALIIPIPGEQSAFAQDAIDEIVVTATKRERSIPFNAAITYEVPYGSRWQMRLFTDYNWMDKYYKEIVNNTTVPEQNMWNARATWIAPHERYSLSWWIKNLGNEEWIIDTLSKPMNLDSDVSVYAMPRTSKLSLTYNFGN